MFELKHVDLNSDGRAEILVRAKTAQFCGAVGNCDFWVIGREGNRLRLLLHADDYVGITKMGGQVLKTLSNGYFDLLVKGHMSASETSYSTYKFNGKRYVETRCRYEVPTYSKNGEKPTWTFISCKEFYRRLNF